jgi:DNA-binding CsgD family transcriptional regulator
VSVEAATPAAPRARRAREVARLASDAVRRLRELGIDPGPATFAADDLEAARTAVDRGLDAVMARLAAAPPALRAELAAIVVELHDARRSIRALRMAGRARPADAIDQSVTRLRNVSSTIGLLDRVCGEAALSCGLSRVALSTIAESDWSVCRFHVDGDAAPADSGVPAELLAMPYDASTPEREVLATGQGAVIPAADPHAGAAGARSPMSAVFSASHVVVPVPVSTGTLGLLHADHHPTDRPADDLDRDLLSAFARAFGQIYERTALQERLERQRRALVAALEAETAAADQLGGAGFALPGAEIDDGTSEAPLPGPPGGNAAIDALLTPREREVLELILAGASNGAIAERLVITTGTVKSHVKRVLRKIGAANRSEAISRYLDLNPGPG